MGVFKLYNKLFFFLYLFILKKKKYKKNGRRNKISRKG
jgi:hypothetical protein